jgi:hypothetical protein
MKHTILSLEYQYNPYYIFTISSFDLWNSISNPSLEGSTTTIGSQEGNLTIDANRRDGFGGGFGSLLVDASNNLALHCIPSWKIYNIHKKK